MESDPFRDIRPYNDAEAPMVLERLMASDELASMLALLRWPRLVRVFGKCLNPLIRMGLRREFRNVRSVTAFQNHVEPYVRRMLDRTTKGFKVTGLENLDENRAHLFISNHRDITLDPALVNYALHRRGRDTVRIAIGDNLLTKDFAADLMRLNKSFIVKRSIKGPKQVLIALRQLSAYIEHSIVVDNAPVWLAEREGRAKDGWDRVDPAIIKMLTMSMPKNGDLSAHIRRLRIVPVTISYEFDPCDAAKAKERYEVATYGHYKKTQHEDLRSIGAGIAGFKGEVQVVFGKMLAGEYDSVETVAREIDRQIVGNYHVSATNMFAWKAVRGEYPAGYSVEDPDANRERAFLDRIESMPAEHRPYALEMYLNPIKNRDDLGMGPAAG